MFAEFACWPDHLSDCPDILRAVPMDPGHGEHLFERNGHGRPGWHEAGDQEAEPARVGHDSGHTATAHPTRVVDATAASCDNLLTDDL
jgi:hypothetical protein